MYAKEDAVALFNETWDLMDMADRTPEQEAAMLHKAHASCFIWMQVGQPIHAARGEWQVSRAYSVLKMGAPALLHANRSLALCQTHGIGDFDLAFAHEAVARACMLLGDTDKMARSKAQALAACEQIEKQEDKDYTLSQLADIA